MLNLKKLLTKVLQTFDSLFIERTYNIANITSATSRASVVKDIAISGYTPIAMPYLQLDQSALHFSQTSIENGKVYFTVARGDTSAITTAVTIYFRIVYVKTSVFG